MEITAASVSASASVSVSGKENDNVNNLTLLASLTLQKVLNIKSNNSDTQIQQKQQLQQQQQLRQSLNISDNNVLNELLKNGAVFTKSVTTPTAPIAIERKRQPQQQQPQQQKHQNSAQKQRLNSSISSTNSSTSTNSSYGSSSDDAAAAATTATTLATPRTTTATRTATTTKASSIKLPEKSKIPSDILDDLASRFIINVPDMELNNLIRICFQIELAHWFYLDFFCAPAASDDAESQKQTQIARKLPVVGIKQFAMQLFQHIPFLNKHFGTVDKILDEWKNYKMSVPTYGAILVSEDHNHCLLVQSYFARNSWGFPKGKINENEDPAHCATREVYEETGFDITDIIDANDYIEAFINYQYTRLYIVRNIPLDTQFAPRTRNEIRCCEWFRIDSLPVNKNDAISKAKLGKNANSFFMIIPFVKRLKKWVNERKAGIEPRRRKCSGQQSPKAASPTNINGSGKKDLAAGRNASRRQRHKSMGDLDGVKLNNLNGKPAGPGSAAPAPAAAAIKAMNICNSNGKRNKPNGAAGSNQSTPVTTLVAAKGGGAGATVSSKRQLFHSQSQNDAQQPVSNDKIVSSFDLIRIEELQLNAAKVQQQQRSRNMSQSENQQPVIKQNMGHQPTTGVDLIAMLSAAAAAQRTPQTEQPQPQQQRPRPASVSLNFGESHAATPTGQGSQDMHRLQRMASGTNLRILKRAQSQQPPQQQVQQLPQQPPPGAADFTPNFNSWTNFSFTKNFIANVFC
ncbi:uncharacterized protein DCP2 isoform X2 [Drosophila bipectinata]|uniref:uncharacterized protein DCP2 isoform X2 n=1 Tax=Drosophila bipectinata TaxID=42026 RepID=UPI0038B335BB